MISVPFMKYTSYGNNFVIVDETSNAVLSEEQKSSFAFKATNTCFGVGCDNLLVVQRCTEAVLASINKARGYWERPPSADSADFVFRMFEPDGEEAFSCGNGLMSIADVLGKRYGVHGARIMTEVPFREPKVIQLESEPIKGAASVNLGHPRRVPDHIASPIIREPVDTNIDLIRNIEVRFRADDLRAYTSATSLSMEGYLVFTGEPHLVIFPGDSFSDRELMEPLFVSPGAGNAGSLVRRRVSVGSWLVRRIGMFLNDQFKSYFPAGINVNFARPESARSTVEYRCFERGIYRETLACGTGAVACAVVARHLKKVGRDGVTVLPHLCRWHDNNAVMQVSELPDGSWSLRGYPRMLIEGNFIVDDRRELSGAGGFASDTMEMLKLENQLLSRPVSAA